MSQLNLKQLPEGAAVICRTLLDTCGWQQSGTVKLPNNRMLEIFTLIEGFTGHAQHPQGIRIGPDVCYRGKGRLLGASLLPKASANAVACGSILPDLASEG